MLKPSTWLDALKVRRAVRGYPVYGPPHKQEERSLPLAQARENFEHFMATKPARMKALQGFMRRFGVTLTDAPGSDAELQAFSRWMDRYFGHLAVTERQDGFHHSAAYLALEAPWTGVFHPLNVMWDIGTYIGEAIIARRPGAHWDVCRGAGHPDWKKSPSYQKPAVYGLRHPGFFEPMSYMASLAGSKLSMLTVGYQTIGFGAEKQNYFAELIVAWAMTDREGAEHFEKQRQLKEQGNG
jgi:hypothetical protein